MLVWGGVSLASRDEVHFFNSWMDMKDCFCILDCWKRPSWGISCGWTHGIIYCIYTAPSQKKNVPPTCSFEKIVPIYTISGIFRRNHRLFHQQCTTTNTRKGIHMVTLPGRNQWFVGGSCWWWSLPLYWVLYEDMPRLVIIPPTLTPWRSALKIIP